MYYELLNTPIGLLEITASVNGVCRVGFEESIQHKPRPNAFTKQCKKQLEEYLSGEREVFNLELDLSGTEFQNLVWQTLLSIPYGQTSSYRDIANKINNPKAVRAVGAANGKNPIAIIVPCHRVIGSNGTLTGYAGGLDRKKWLLKHENQYDNSY